MSEFLVSRNQSYSSKTKTLREYEKTEITERRRNILYLIGSYLRDRNLLESYQTLVNEAQLTNQYEVCDNVDLDIILQDYQSYYYTKFNKNPKIVKKVEIDYKPEDNHKRKVKSSLTTSSSTKDKDLADKKPDQTNSDNNVQAFQIAVKRLGQKGDGDENLNGNGTSVSGESKFNAKSLCEFKQYTPEWREMADLIIKEIVPKNLGVTWGDCIGVHEGIAILKETVIYPMEHPSLFTGILSPWRGVLLYGPPGTGKTHLAKAVACEAACTFINVRSSSFISKWRGESERMLKVLFDVAKFYEPTTIFIDEIDAIANNHDDALHDASRRFKSELLIQMDGILNGDEQVFVLATTNTPWNLDPAILRRFEKRVLLNSPNRNSRTHLFKHFFDEHKNDFTDAEFIKMSDLSEGYSGADIKCVCKEALMSTVREIIRAKGSASIEPRKPKLEDVVTALQKVTPTVNSIATQKYNDWHKKFGSM